MSEYLRQIGGLTKKRTYKTYTTFSPRELQIQVIQDMLNGYEAEHAKNRWKTSKSKLSDEDWYKMYVSYNYMKKIIHELKILAPYMKTFNTEDIKKVALLNKTLENLKWNQLLYEIYETLETKGDFFAYWSTKEEQMIDGIPVLKVLESENMQEIELDDITKEVKAYIYKEYVEDYQLDESTGTVNIINGRQVTWIFKRGYIRINDPVKYVNEGGYKIFYNHPDYADEFRIIHIPSFKKQNEPFSQIPAIDYIDPCLLLAKIDTNRSIINDHLGFPFPFIVGGYIDDKNSALIPGGAGYVIPEDWALNIQKMPEIVKMEINNDLQSIIDEKYDAVSDLYKKACLIREGLEEKLSSSDSSRNISQLRLGIEQKNKKYYINIAEEFAKYFRVVLKENGLLTKKEFENKTKITFKLPDVLINNSIFDDLLVRTQKRALGLSTLEEELIEEGKSEKEIQKRKELITEEIYGKNSDMSFTNTPKEIVSRVSNGANTNLDNNFKTETNIQV